MSKRNADGFDYENAKRDIFDNGGDPDYLDEWDPKKRDKFLRDMGLNPGDYGGQKKKSSGSDEGCFVTTACVKALDLPDDCEELTILRRFRDEYVKARDGGAEDVRTYYDLAPQVVRRIDTMENAAEIWKDVYRQMVLPCVALIRQGKPEAAYGLYKSYTLRLAAVSAPREGPELV